MPLATVEEAIQDIRDGKFVVVVDDEDRENEGDLVLAAEHASAEHVNFMARYGRGLICMPIIGKRLDDLKIPLMVPPDANSATFGTAFTVSVEAKRDVTTGISAHDRATTVKAILDPSTKPEDLARPGHMFPLRAKEGGVLVRAGQTEASVDLARLAGLYPAGVICEIMNEDGTMARMPQLEEFSRCHGIKIISVAQLIEYRLLHETLIERVAEAQMPTKSGDFTIVSYRSLTDHETGVALVMGEITPDQPMLVRVHSECLTGDVFSSLRCDCGEQLSKSLEMVSAEGRGVILYMRQEGRGIGLHNKLLAYQLQDVGLDTVEANVRLGFAPDLRHYGVGAQILRDLGVRKLKLLTNNPKKVVGLAGYGLEVVERIPIEIPANPNNVRYLLTKRDKLGHLLNGLGGVLSDEAVVGEVVGTAVAEPAGNGQATRRGVGSGDLAARR